MGCKKVLCPLIFTATVFLQMGRYTKKEHYRGNEKHQKGEAPVEGPWSGGEYGDAPPHFELNENLRSGRNRDGHYSADSTDCEEVRDILAESENVPTAGESSESESIMIASR